MERRKEKQREQGSCHGGYVCGKGGESYRRGQADRVRGVGGLRKRY